ncbi:S-adenosyl-L-methionine-dependent methyltransferase [Mycena floridula]|nr:S-adenosyl-L-methionine-dependent methyltransferase [Mycena floridula]
MTLLRALTLQRQCRTRFFSTKIEKIILDTIKATGPLSFAKYMQMCLLFPKDGYYMKSSNPVFGSKGDFITSPEISQVFGELLGIWLVSQWKTAGQHPSIRLIELGPGRGTLMADILRMIQKFAPPNTLKNVHLVENSPFMRSLQAEKLGEASRLEGFNLEWHEALEDVDLRSEEYTMVVAHEFFDAMPIHVLKKKEQGWHEVMVSDSRTAESPDNPHLALAVSSSPSTAAGLMSFRFPHLPIDSQVEISPVSFKIAHQIGLRLTKQKSENSAGGCGLIIDYGQEGAASDSFRAFKDHKMVDPFHRPGECDLTADVDFSYLRAAMENLVHVPPAITQGEFLLKMGLVNRVNTLAEHAATPERGAQIVEAAQRLVDPNGMGNQYKIMAITDTEGSNTWPFTSV